MEANSIIGMLIDNIWVIVAALACIAIIVLAIVNFVRTPNAKKLDKVRGWLLWAVTKAEAEFGKETGKLKLSYVYDLFVARFPWLAKVVSFEMFAGKVDEALDTMRELLSKDPELLNKVPAETTIKQENKTDK